MGKFITTVTIIQRWTLCSCHRNSTYSGRMATFVPGEMLRCPYRASGPPYCESDLFSAADVAIQSGIKMLFISMVASKMLMPKKKTKSPKKGNGYRCILSVNRIILRWILHSCHIQKFYSGRTANVVIYCKNSWVAMQVHHTSGIPIFFRLQRWP